MLGENDRRENDRRARERVEGVLAAVVFLLIVGIVLQRWTPTEPPPPELPQLPWGTWIDTVLDEDGRGAWAIESVAGQAVTLEANSVVLDPVLRLLVPGDEEEEEIGVSSNACG